VHHRMIHPRAGGRNRYIGNGLRADYIRLGGGMQPSRATAPGG
jgi:hypothetical protein